MQYKIFISANSEPKKIGQIFRFSTKNEAYFPTVHIDHVNNMNPNKVPHKMKLDFWQSAAPEESTILIKTL